MTLIEKRFRFLSEVLQERGDAFIGIEVYDRGGTKLCFAEVHVLEITKEGIMICDFRKSNDRKFLRENHGIEFPGILLLDLSKANSDGGFEIENCTVHITD